jgi:replicative DNA helicase
MTISLEKVFFAYIIKNKRYFDIVEPFFFKNVEIQFVYTILRNYMIKNSDAEVPHPKQILEMVSLEDRDGLITKEILKAMLTVNLIEYDEINFIVPRFNAWILSNRLKSGTVDIIDETRNLDTVNDFESAVVAANKIKSIVDQMSKTDFVNDDDMGSDFDDPENHVQDSAKFKIRSGFETIDHMLGGGWDISTLNVIMAETNNGKCTFLNTNIHIRDSILGVTKTDKISSIFSKVSKGDYNTLLDGKYDVPLYDKFIEAYQVNNLQVETPNGWVNIEGIGKTIQYEEWRLFTSGGKELICADNHLLYRCDNINFSNKKCELTEIYCKNLILGDFIMTKDGPEMIMEFGITGNKSHMYDLQISEGSNKQYYTNDILSHNSLWMQNFAVKSADMGYNVLYITLEMSERKVMKRVGAMRLRIPINDYDNVSKDTEAIKKKIENLKNTNSSDLFEKKIGKIITRFWAAGTATVNDFDNYIQKLKEKKGIKIDLVIVDYITLVAAVKGIAGDNLYTKGKSLAEGLRAIGAKYKIPVITGVQVSKDAWNANDITLEQVPESKAIAETADVFFAIIRTEEMKRQGIYRFKLLKQRDGDFLKSQVRLNLNSTYLTLENDVFLDSI